MSDADRPGPEPQETTMPDSPVRRRRPREGSFEIGKVFGTSLSIWARNLGPFVIFALVVMLPHGLALRWLDQFGRAGPLAMNEPENYVLATGAVFLLRSLMGTILTATVIGSVVLQLRGRRPGLGEVLTSGIARVPAVIGVAIVQALLYAACFVPALFVAALEARGLGALLLIAGTVALGVVYCGVYVAAPAAVAERPGVFGAIGKSWRLTRGNRARICVVVVLLVVSSWIAGAILGGLGAALTDRDWFWAWSYGASALVASLEAVFLAVVYHDLRVTVDGVATEDIAAVFD